MTTTTTRTDPPPRCAAVEYVCVLCDEYYMCDHQANGMPKSKAVCRYCGAEPDACQCETCRPAYIRSLNEIQSED